MVFDNLCCDLPDKWNLADPNLVDQGLEVCLIEVIVNYVTKKVKCAESGCRMGIIVEGETDPTLSFIRLLVYFGIVVGQEGENPRHLDGRKLLDSFIANDDLKRGQLWLVVSDSIGENGKDEERCFNRKNWLLHLSCDET